MSAERFEIVITAMIANAEGRFLVIRRSDSKKRFPGRWTVPGGRLETADFTSLPKDTAEYWYNVLERTLRREVEEEVGIQIRHIEYVTSLATVHADGSPSLVISCLAEYESGEVTLQLEEADQFAWINLEEAKGYDLIDGIYDELVMAEQQRTGQKREWSRA
jgi:8-oxo-dGTP diphosphatase